jgi:hypothetical protein
MRTHAYPPSSTLSCNQPVLIQRPSAPRLLTQVAALICLAMFMAAAAMAAEDVWLWQVGTPDQKNSEFALAPGGFSRFNQDGFFLVGASTPQQDWPYVHPGLQDAWAGGRPHPFTILFVLKKTPALGECRLQLDLLDTQASLPPTLRIQINDQTFERALPRGGGDDSINGDSSKGKPTQVSIPFPSTVLKEGDNKVTLTIINGCWMLYDSVGLATPPGAELSNLHNHTLIQEAQPIRGLVEKEGTWQQPIRVVFRHFGPETDALLRVDGSAPMPLAKLKEGLQTNIFLTPAVTADTDRKLDIETGGQTKATRMVHLKPVPKLTVYVLPHSHTDIGYTEIQTDIEKKQVNNLLQGIEYAKKTANYPAGSRFVWNVEVLWAADLYLRRMDDTQRAAFLDAVKSGQVALCGMYLNELTGLCRPEELLRLFRFSTELAQRCGITIDSAMISDVPGNTWGTVTAMNHAGIKYFSTAPNYFDRIGTILREWENKPFYWMGPDGKSKVLVWIPFWGYAMSHRYGRLTPELVDDFCDGLAKRGYTYDIAHVRWSGHGDNAVPDLEISEAVKDWNSKYAWPKFVISSASEAFQALEKRYGSQLPVVRGDWTPYWEDGAGSSSLETGMNRTSSDRLAQAETLFAMLRPQDYPKAAFNDAWNNVLLYSEHTWGAWCSVNEPERKETKEQWAIKRGYATQASQQSETLLAQAIGGKPANEPVFDVFNTLSWTRTDLVTLSPELAALGTSVVDDAGKPVPSQKLASGEMTFLAAKVPAFGSRRYRMANGSPSVSRPATVNGAILDNGIVRVRIDEITGGIAELTLHGLTGNFADTTNGETLNDYRYLIGDDLANLQRNGPVKLRIGEKGPIVASLIVNSEAPGCRKLQREIRIVAGMDHVEIINTVDKARLDVKSYMAKEGKESVNFAFPFNVPDGQILLDIPLGVMRPELDQMPSACKNWFTVGRWAEVSNKNRGITWVTLDAPLVEVGGITATLLNSQTNPDVWRKKVEPTQKIYSWSMNNHWGTNYRAYQDGPVVFRFVLRPHRQSNPVESARFGLSRSFALLPVRASQSSQPVAPLLQVDSPGVLVSALKPADDGNALIIRLSSTLSKTHATQITWRGRKPKALYITDVSEKPGKRVTGSIKVPGNGLVSLRAEF